MQHNCILAWKSELSTRILSCAQSVLSIVCYGFHHSAYIPLGSLTELKPVIYLYQKLRKSFKVDISGTFLTLTQ